MDTKSTLIAQRVSAPKFPPDPACNWANSILDNNMGDLLESRHLLKHPKHNDVWCQSFSKWIRRIATTLRLSLSSPNPKFPEARWKDITYGCVDSILDDIINHLISILAHSSLDLILDGYNIEFRERIGEKHDSTKKTICIPWKESRDGIHVPWIPEEVDCCI